MDQPPATGSPALVRGRARRPQGGPEEGCLTALEPSEPSRKASARLRLATAARAATSHPNLLRAWAVGEAESRLFVAFEPCQHPSLTELLATGPLGPADCARVLDGAASGVDALSRQGLVARDLTPERVLVDPRHGGMLMDLGIPPELMRPLPLEQDPDLAFRSPEELSGQLVDIRSSVYSLGAILFTALTGDPPYSGTWSDVYASLLEGAAPRPSEWRSNLPPEVDAVVAQAMAASPGHRYATAKELSGAAAAALGADPARERLPADRVGNERPRRPQPTRSPVSPQPSERPPTASPAAEDRAHRAKVPAIARRPLRRTKSLPAKRLGARSAAAVRRGIALMMVLVSAVATGVGRAAWRAACVVWALSRRGSRLVLTAAGRVGALLANAGAGVLKGSAVRVGAGAAAVGRMFGGGKPHVRRLARRRDVDGLIDAARYGRSGGDRTTLEFAAPVREQAIVALGKLGAEAGDGAVIEALRDPSDRVRAAAVRVLHARREAEPLVEGLGWLPALRGQSRRLAVRAVVELCTPGSAKAVARVLVHRIDDEPLGEEDAALVLTLLPGDERHGAANELVDEVMAALADERDVVADRAEELLVELAPISTEAVIAALEAGAVPHRAASVLAAINDTRALDPLVQALGHRDPRVRIESAAALGELGDPAALGPLLRAARDPEHPVRIQAGRALDRIGAVAVASDASLLVRPMILDAVRSAATERARHGAPYKGKDNVPALTAAGFPQRVDAAKLRDLVALLDRLNDPGRLQES